MTRKQMAAEHADLLRQVVAGMRPFTPDEARRLAAMLAKGSRND